MLATKSVLAHLEVIEGKLCEGNWTRKTLHNGDRYCLLGHLQLGVDWDVYCRACNWLLRVIGCVELSEFNDNAANVEEIKVVLRKSADYMRETNSNKAAIKYINIAIERIKSKWDHSTSLKEYLSGDWETVKFVEEIIHKKYGKRMDLPSFSRFAEDENTVISLLNDAKYELFHGLVE